MRNYHTTELPALPRPHQVAYIAAPPTERETERETTLRHVETNGRLYGAIESTLEQLRRALDTLPANAQGSRYGIELAIEKLEHALTIR